MDEITRRRSDKIEACNTVREKSYLAAHAARVVAYDLAVTVAKNVAGAATTASIAAAAAAAAVVAAAAKAAAVAALAAATKAAAVAAAAAELTAAETAAAFTAATAAAAKVENAKTTEADIANDMANLARTYADAIYRKSIAKADAEYVVCMKNIA